MGPMRMRLEWKRDQFVELTTGAELDATLDTIEQDRSRTEPVLAMLNTPKGFLAIGIGHPTVGILMAGPHDRRTAPVHAVGDPAARAANDPAPFLMFASYGRRGEFAKWLGIPKSTIRTAVRYFLEHGGTLWEGVVWEEEKQSG